MDILLSKINDLQEICSSSGISHSLELPQIVVIGSQSSGKSSVLENIVGRDFLPRGTGIVTRRPIILQLININSKNNYDNKDGDNTINKSEYAQFNGNDKIYYNYDDVKSELLRLTSLIKANDVSDIPIILKLYSPNFLSLTLVDLPGLTKVATSNQPKNICSKIENMCMKYIQNKNAIILAVSAATNDISNSDALELARMADANFDRTIGVLTKVDLMDRGTDAVDILAGKIINLKLGFVPVVNRSVLDIKKNKNIKDSLATEMKFFSDHPSYSKNKNFCGTKYLINKLNTILQEHIKYSLPELQERVNKLLTTTENELDEIGMIDLQPKEIVLKSITDISRYFSASIKNNNKINYTFHVYFTDTINNLEINISDDEIKKELQYSGKALLFNNHTFELLVRKSLKEIKPYATQLVSIIFTEIVKIVQNETNKKNRFPLLQQSIVTAIINLFRKKSDNTLKIVESILEWNIECINTRHPDFICWNDILENNNSNITSPTKSRKEFDINFKNADNSEVNIIKSLVLSYFNIIKKIIIDQVPKAIMTNLVYKSERLIQETLLKEIYELKDIESKVIESEDVKEKRNRMKKRLLGLKQAYNLLCSL
ncbi:Dynamin-like vacuolar sorting GTPase [Spraguea lophii 42_110]|uniref:Dynamin-like vacuolar sorting GTPase n=1 Tax=Spraguea lophii (strain 42_110) TaxID=1358809 RepID=S7XU97_SPRLO|nr:Dynamin-like vacuolar sorting GTPase [Spraguea lophii 42_110]